MHVSYRLTDLDGRTAVEAKTHLDQPDIRYFDLAGTYIDVMPQRLLKLPKRATMLDLDWTVKPSAAGFQNIQFTVDDDDQRPAGSTVENDSSSRGGNTPGLAQSGEIAMQMNIKTMNAAGITFECLESAQQSIVIAASLAAAWMVRLLLL